MAAVLACVAILALPASTVRLDNDFSKLYSTTTEADAFRLTYRDVFGANDGLLVAVLDPVRPDDPRFIQLLHDLTEATANDDAIERVFSVTRTALPVDVDDVLVFGPLFGPDAAFEGNHATRVKRMAESPLGQRLMSKDGTFYVLAAEVDKSRTSYESVVGPDARFRRRVQDGVAASGLPIEVRFAGIPRTRVHATEALEGDLFYLSPFVTVVLALLMFLFLRSLWAVGITLLAVGLAVVATAGVVGLYQDDLNFVTVLYPILLTAVIVAHAIHLFHQYRHELEQTDGDFVPAIQKASARVVRAAFLTSTTTAIGFGSLMAARATILRTFGLYLSIGVLISFAVVTLVLPSCFALLGDRLFRLRGKSAGPKTEPSLNDDQRYHWFDSVIDGLTTPKGARFATLAGLLILVATFLYAKDVRFDYVLSDHSKGEAALIEGNDIVDKHLGGIVPIEVSLLGSEDDFRKAENLQRMQECADWLEQHYDVPPAIGLSTVLREIHEQFGGSETVPDNDALAAQLLLVAESSSDGIVSQLVTDDFSHARIRTSASDRGANYIVSMWREFDRFAATVFEGTGIHPRMTGGMVVGYQGMKQLSVELMRSVLIALALVVLVIGIAFRSFRLALASVLPNVLPVGIGLALLRASGSVVNPIPGLVFCIGIGLSVDDTIHLFSRYREELHRGATNRNAVRLAVRYTRGALVTTTVILTIGMGLLLLSSSDLNRTMGWLAGSVFITALAADLLVTPAILSVLRSESPESKC